MAPYYLTLSLLLLSSAVTTFARPFRNPDILGPVKVFPEGGDPVYTSVDNLSVKSVPKLQRRGPPGPSFGLLATDPIKLSNVKPVLKAVGLNVLHDDKPTADDKPKTLPRDGIDSNRLRLRRRDPLIPPFTDIFTALPPPANGLGAIAGIAGGAPAKKVINTRADTATERTQRINRVLTQILPPSDKLFKFLPAPVKGLGAIAGMADGAPAKKLINARAGTSIDA